MSLDTTIREHLLKILVIGAVGTGKSSLIKQYVHNVYSDYYRATIGVDFALKVIQYDPCTTVRLQLWDIAGQDRHSSMLRVFFKEAVGAFVVCDVTRPETQSVVPFWKRELDSKVELSDGNPLPCVLLANKRMASTFPDITPMKIFCVGDVVKNDVYSRMRPIVNEMREFIIYFFRRINENGDLCQKCDCPKEGMTQDAAQLSRFCQEHGFCMWFETSAKANFGLDSAVQHLVMQILETVPFPDVNDADEQLITLSADDDVKVTKSALHKSDGDCCF